MTNNDDENHLDKIVFKAENIHQIQNDIFKLIFYHPDQWDYQFEAYFSNLFGVCIIKIANDWKKYSNDQILDYKQKCEYLLNYLDYLLKLDKCSLSKHQILCLIDSLVNSNFNLKSFETFNCTFDSFKNGLKQAQLPSLVLKTRENDDFISQISNQFKIELVKHQQQDKKSKESLIQLNLKYLVKTNKLKNFIENYMQINLAKLNEYKSTKHLDYSELKKNLSQISLELACMEGILGSNIINHLTIDLIDKIVNLFIVLFQIIVVLSAGEGDTNELQLVSNVIKAYNSFIDDVRTSDKHMDCVYININEKIAYYLSASLEKVISAQNKEQSEAASPRVKDKIRFNLTFNNDLARLSIKLVEMVRVVAETSEDTLHADSYMSISQLTLDGRYTSNQIRSLFTIKLIKLLPNILDLSFRKCQSIFLTHKKPEQEEVSNALSEKNVEEHNKDQLSEVHVKKAEENVTFLNSDQIKDIDAEDTSEDDIEDEEDDDDDDEEENDDDDDSEFLLLAPWFNEETANTSQAGDVDSQASSNITQVLENTFELDSNQSYTRYIDLMIDIFRLYEALALNEYPLIFGDKELKELSFIINEIEFRIERLPERFVTAFIKFLQILIHENAINKDNLCEYLGLKLGDWPLRVHEYTLSIQTQILINSLHQKYDNKPFEFMQSILFGFLETLKKSIAKTANKSDVNIEHMEFLVFVFHQLPLEIRQIYLKKVAMLIIELNEKHHTLLLSRLILFFYHLIHSFDEISQEISSKIKSSLELNASKLITRKKSKKITSNDENFASLFENSCDFIDSIEKYYEYYNENSSNETMKPKFYSIYAIKSSRPSVNAISVLEKDDQMYIQLYSSLIKLLKFNFNSKTSTESSALDENLAQSYLFFIVWHLLEQLPISDELNLSDESYSLAFKLHIASKNKTKIKQIVLENDNITNTLECLLKIWSNEKANVNSNIFAYHLNLIRNLMDNSLEKINDDLVTRVLDLVKMSIQKTKTHLKRKLLLEKYNSMNMDKMSEAYLDTLNSLLGATSNENTEGSLTDINQFLPKNLQIFLKKYFETSLKIQSNISKDDLDSILWIDVKFQEKNEEFCVKNRLVEMVRFITACSRLSPSNHSINKLLIELNSDYICSNFLSELCSSYLTSNEIGKDQVHAHTHQVIFDLLTSEIFDNQYLTNEILIELLNYIESSISGSQVAQKGFLQVYDDKNKSKLIDLLMTTSKLSANVTYFTKMISILNAIFKQNELEQGKYSSVLEQLNKIGEFDAEFIQKWLSKLVIPPASSTIVSSACLKDSKECKIAMHQLTIHLVFDKNIKEVVTLSILSALIQLASKLINNNYGIGFSDLIALMDTLSNAGTGLGHFYVFQACCIWLEYFCSLHLDKFNSINTSENNYQIESVCHLLGYIANILNTYRDKSGLLNLIRPNEQFPEALFDYDFYHNSFYTPFIQQEEGKVSQNKIENKTPAKRGESDESEEDDVELHTKLCTYTVTKKEFMNQHWYYCHTCKMIDKIGVCSICARVCHKGHDLSYAKFGSFFCDCGAKEDGSCKSLKKREQSNKSCCESLSLCAPNSSTESQIDQHKLDSLKETKQKQLEKLKSQIFECINGKDLLKTIKTLLSVLVPSADTQYKKSLLSTNTRQARDDLNKMIDSNEKTIECADQLFIATLGSQEGAFENVRMNYSSEQGQQIKALIGQHSLRRVSMCCLTSKTRKHLIVTHEKGKSSHFTVLQLNALLKQDSNKRNILTLTKLNTVQVPYTLISVTANLSNDDYIALNGLKDCHVMYLNENGQSSTDASTSIILHASLEGSNYIIKSLWLPNSSSEIALVTCDFIKIFDLSVDTISPAYYFLLPSGKIKDVTFYTSSSGAQFILMMSSNGYIYYEQMNAQTSAKNGMYYLTNTIDFAHAEVKNSDGGVLGNGGVSIYYSSQLKLLFWSFQCGKTFIASFKHENDLSFKTVIHLKLNKGGGDDSPSKSLQALCQFSEIQSHPGLVLAMTYLSNNPIVIMLQPEKIIYQEIKLSASKSKIQDMVATRHTVGEPHEGEKTTMIILCDDGSLKIYVASTEKTHYWLQPHMKPVNPLIDLRNLILSKKSQSKPLAVKDDKQVEIKKQKVSKPIKFPIDFFEKSTQLNDIEYGGNDLLEIYNTQQIKTRLVNNRKVVCNRPNGFTIEITNKESNMVITGCRVLVGLSSTDKVPSYFECLSGAVKVPVGTLSLSRWYDICLTREQSYILDNKLSLFIGVSTDSSFITIIDSIRVYGKTKEQFGWKDDECQRAKTCEKELVPKTQETVSTCESNDMSSEASIDRPPLVTLSTPNRIFDKLLSNGIEILEHCLIYSESDEIEREWAHETCKKLLGLMTPAVVSLKIRSLLYTICSNKERFFKQIDESKLSLIVMALKSYELNIFDFECFQKMILICRSILFERSISMVKYLNESFEGQFVGRINELFWSLYDSCEALPSIGYPLVNDLLEVIVESLIEVMHAYSLVDSACEPLVADSYVRLLACNDTSISFTAKRVLLQLLKPRKKREVRSSQVAVEQELVESVDQEIAVPMDTGELDDEEMMQFAMALSMNETQQAAEVSQASVTQATGNAPRKPKYISQESSNDMSISEDEDLLNVSLQQNNSDQECTNEVKKPKEAQKRVVAVEVKKSTAEIDDLDFNFKLFSIRKIILERFCHSINTETFASLQNGIKSIPFFQCILTLISDLTPNSEQDKALLGKIVKNMLALIEPIKSDLNSIVKRTPDNETKLIIIRALSVLLSKSKYQKDGVNFIIQHTLDSLNSFGAIEMCLELVKHLYSIWKETPLDDAVATLQNQQQQHLAQSNKTCFIRNGLLVKKEQDLKYLDEMSPFFVRDATQKGPTCEIFYSYLQWLSEIIMRLPYQMRKLSDSKPHFNLNSWCFYLCEYLILPQCQFLKRLIKKLLQLLCGSKDKYRKFKDHHILVINFKEISNICPLKSAPVQKSGGDQMFKTLDEINPKVFSYNNLLVLVENLKLIHEIAITRTINWQKFCIDNPTTLLFLLEISLIIDETITQIILQLLLCALGGIKSAFKLQTPKQQQQQSLTASQKPSSKSSKASNTSEENLSQVLIGLFFKNSPRLLLNRFLRMFLLESSQENLRWIVHSLMYSVYKHSPIHYQEIIYDLMIELWSDIDKYGLKASQFIDLIGYVVIKSQSNPLRLSKFTSLIVDLFKKANHTLATHPNSTLYHLLAGHIEFDGFYLEHDPCFICNSPEVPLQTLKLSSIKVDSRFTTNTQIVKLVSSHSIAKIHVKISDIRKSKMINTLNIYYSNKSVKSIVDLKNKSNVWLKAKKVTLQPAQTEVKIDFVLPIVACNLMIEYADFFEHISVTSETQLQCPRCSATVPAHPGVCGNCGENVFQCHKCRSINYDERDPFLCNACGFCKFGKFEYSLVAKACCDVDPIENEDDRKKTMQTISDLLEKADKSYKALSNVTRPALEGLIIKMNEQFLSGEQVDKLVVAPPPPPPPQTSTTTATTGTNNAPPGQPAPPTAIKVPSQPASSTLPCVNKIIHQIATKYNTECKSTFEELSKIIQKLSLCRKELREYDRQFKQQLSEQITQRKGSNCYGCAFACVEYCVTLLRAILVACGTEKLKNELCSKTLLEELVNFNLKRPFLTLNLNGTTRDHGRDVVNLIYLLIKDNSFGSEVFNRLIINKIDAFLKPMSKEMSSMSTLAINDPNALRHEMLLLSALIQKQDDSSWESRLRLIIQILLKSLTPLTTNPCVMDSLVLPCLKMLNFVCKSAFNNSALASKQVASKKTLFKSQISEPAQLQSDQLVTYSTEIMHEMNPIEFLNTKDSYYMKWVKFNITCNSSILKLDDEKNLKKKCFYQWCDRYKALKTNAYDLNIKWLRNCLFCPSSKLTRQISCQIIQNMFSFWTQFQGDSTYCLKKFAIAKLLSSFLAELSTTGENFSEFFTLYKSIVTDRECKFRLVLKEHILCDIEHLLINEIRVLSDLERGECSATNLTLGFSVKCLAELIAEFLKEPTIKNKFKARLVATILNSYLSLKKLIYQRTKLIEEAQEKLLESLEEMTSGTQSETRKFMSICIDTVNKFDTDDLVTPVYLFERVCNIIYPEDTNDNKEFFLLLEKDPNQEDYLQGRMLGNPYSSLDPSMAPLMRNIKNKICADCELIALLDDDNGMELLVNNKIISLDLPIRDVFKKLWLAEGASESEPMKIVYRMTGLSGDATEDIIDNLDGKSKDQTKSDEEIYKMADELAHNNALKVMLDRLCTINATNFTLGKPLLSVLVKLFGYALKLSVNRQEIVRREMSAIKTMLSTLNMIFKIETCEPNKVGVQLAEQLLALLECVLSEASKQPSLMASGGDTEQLKFLLNNIKCSFVRTNPSLLEALMRIIPFLSFGDESKMQALIEYFKPYYSSFDKYDTGAQSNEDTIHLECFCVIVNGIEQSENGSRLRDLMCDSGVLRESMDYLIKNSPKVTTYLNSDFEKWKDFLAKSSLSFVLRILTGLSRAHERIQELIGETLVPLLHKLEQFSTGSSRIGVLGEDLLLQLKSNQKVAKTIEQVQAQTKAEKKKLAMAMRNKQLSQLGMRTNEKGQLLSDPRAVKISESEIEEEKGHTCRICREGYKYHPQKCLAIYTFTKKCEIDAHENKPRKSLGYSTVTHFNLVHIDCHSNAIRVARSNRDEWENATLLNANTKCNGLLPLWGPDVPETVFSTALARHNSYLSETTGIRDTTYSLNVHDLKMLLLRFAENQSFSEDTGGGGRESNICLVPCMIHMILYSVNVAKYVTREERNLTNFLESSEKLIQNSFESDNVFYYLTMALNIMKPSDWFANRVKFLERTILTAHCRVVISSSDKSKLINTSLQDFKKYKPALLFFGLVNLFFNKLHNKVTHLTLTWTESLASYIRLSDIQMIDVCYVILKEFEEDLSKCEDWSEMIDVCGLLSDLPDPQDYFNRYLSSIK